ncbi:MAG: MFS transporter, partial [Chloroflexi bacterium]|nr:MFS transporter [Chloroflexota bacterium]
MRHLRSRDYIAFSAYFFGLSYMWNSLHVIILPALLVELAPAAWKNTYLAALSLAGLALATAIQPLTGHLSDRTASRWGRRRPWILAGTLGDFVCLALVGLSGSYAMLLAAYLLLQASSNSAHSAAQGFIPDLVPATQRGLSSSAKTLADILGLIAGGFIAGRMVGAGSPAIGLVSIAGVLALVLAVTWLGVREDPQGPQPVAEALDPVSLLRSAFHLDRQRFAPYAWLLLARLLVLAGVTPIQGFAQYYLQDHLGVANPAAATGRLMVVIGVSVLLVLYPAGLLADRWGPWALNVLAALVGSLGTAGLVVVHQFWQALILASLVGMAMGVFMSANWALATRLVPQEAGGRYLGLSNLATGGAGALGRLVGPLIDGVNLLLPGWGYPALFAASTLCMWGGVAVLWRVRQAGLAHLPPGDA